MKKTGFLLLGLCFALTVTMAQQSEWMKRYWNYRDRFHKHFVHLGTEAGDGLPAANRPMKRFNDFPFYISSSDQQPYNGMRFGDVTADLGDYIAVLATEYKILKDQGKDLTPTLNELYFALDAFERADKQAEVYLSIGQQPPNVNGFFMRGDVPENYKHYWNDEYINTQDPLDFNLDGIRAPGHFTNEPSNHFSIGNEESQDQVIGLFVGFALVKKYVDNVSVSPRAGIDPPKQLVTQVQQITNRILSYAQTTKTYESQASAGVCGTEYKSLDLNWEVNNPITQEPVKSGGGNLQYFIYPMQCTRKFITNGSFTYPNLYAHLKYDYSGTFCNTIQGGISVPYPLQLWNDIQDLDFSTGNNGGTNVNNTLCISVPVVNEDICWDILPFGWSVPVADYNVNMMLSLASTSDASQSNWSHYNIARISDDVDMEIFDLLYAALHNVSPLIPKSTYEQILASAPNEGPYFYDLIDNSPGWIQNSRWSHPHKISFDNPGGQTGNDYMWLYNLYKIVYGNDPAVASTPYGEEYTCTYESCPGIVANMTGSDLSNSTTVIRKFIGYLDFDINIKEYLNQNLNIPSGKTLSMQANLILCNNQGLQTTLEIQDGGRLEVGDPANDSKKYGGILVKAGHQLILRTGSTLSINDNSTVIIEPGAFMTIEPGAVIELKGTSSLLDVQGTLTNLTLANTEQITFTKAGTSTGGLAQFANGLITMETGSTFINDGCRLKMFDVDYRHDATFILQNNSNTDFKFSNDITLNTGEIMPVLQDGAPTGGTLILNSNDDVNHYRNFVLNSDANINSDGCKIRLIKYHFDYFQNGNIHLNGDDASLVFGGTININADADLHFDGSGYFGFRLEQDWTDYQNITATPTSTITMIGSDNEDKVMHVEQNTWVHGNDDMGKFKVHKGKIIFDSGSQITLATPYELYDLNCEGSGNGFLLGGVEDHKIDRVNFTGLEYCIRGVLSWAQGAPLNVTNCTFKNSAMQAIDVVGKGLNLTNCLFDENFTWNINARDMEFKSIFRDVTIRLSYDEMVNFTTPSSGSLYIIDSHFNSGYGVVFNGPNELTFQCSEVNAFQGRNLTLGLDAQLVASPQLKPRAGHTNFHSFRGAIFNDAKTITIDQGHNDFSIEDLRPFDPIDPQFIMYGVLKGFQSSQLSAINNTWYAGSTNPLLNTDYKLWRSGGAVGPPKNLDMIGNLPEAIGDCPFEPQPPINNDAGRVHPLVYCDKCPEVQVANLYLPLNNAVKMAIDTLSDDTLRYDLIGINLLRDILMQSMEYDIDNTNELTELAYVRLKQALGNAYRFGLLRANEGSNDYVEKVLQVVNRKTERARWADNDNDEYYSMLDQAAVYRLINDRVRATEILNSLPSCLEMTEEQHYFLEALIRNYQAEEMVISGAMPIEEFWEYAQGDQRTFQKFANTQANIDTIWVDSIPFATVPAALTTAMDGDGNTYNVVSAADSSLNYKITKTDAGNTTVWEQYFDGWQNSTDSVKAITMDANSYIYVTGKSWNGYDYDIATVKYDTAGNQYWTAIYNDLETGNDEPYSIAVDSAFHVLIYAHSFNDTVNLYKQIFYTQCDSTCIPQRKADDGKKEVPQEFSIQPNPATTTITIVINDEQANDSYKINLYDMKGKKVLSKFITSNFTLDVSKLAKGAYHVQLSNLTTKKILKGRNVVIN